MSDAETEKPVPVLPAADGAASPAAVCRDRRAPVGRVVLRAGVILLAITMLGLWQAAGSRPTAATGDGAWALTLSLLSGDEFGRADVYLGDEPSGSPPVDEAALIEAVRAAAAEGRSEVLLRAAGNVPYGELLRVYQAASRAVPEGGGVRVRLVLREASR